MAAVHQYFLDYEGEALPNRSYFFKVVSTTIGWWLLDQINAALKNRVHKLDEEKCRKQVEM